MPNNAANVLATRNWIVYTTPWAATTAQVADTVAWGTAWGTPSGQATAYTEAGFTQGDIRTDMGIDRTDIRVDQSIDPIYRPGTGRNVVMQTNFAEVTPQNVQIAAGNGTITTTVGPPTTAQLDLTSVITDNYYTVGYDILHPGDAAPYRIYGWKGLSVGRPSLVVSPTAPTVAAMSMQCLPDTTSTPPRILTIHDIS
jgi:hypothetical protein